MVSTTVERPPFPLIVSITLTGIIGSTIVIPVLPDVVADLGGGTAGIGLLVAATAAPGIFLAPLIGVLADRYGRREVVVPCLALFGVSGVLAALAPNFAFLFVCRLLQGAGSAGLVNLAITIIGDHWQGEERTRMLGRNAAALTAVIVVSPALGGLLGTLSWRAAFAPLALALVTAAAVALKLPRSAHKDVTVGQQLRSSAPYLRSRTVLGVMAVGLVIFMLIFGMFLTILPAHLKDAFGAPSSVRGLVSGSPAFTMTLSALLVGRLAARFGSRRMVAAALLGMAAGFALLGLATALPMVFFAAVVYGLGEGLIIPLLQDTAASAAPDANRGSVVALFIAACRLGQTIGPLLAAAALTAFGARAAFLGAAAMAVATAAATPLAIRPATRPAETTEPAEAIAEDAASLS